MQLGILEMYVIMTIIGLLILLQRRDAAKVAETQNIKRLDTGESENRREYVVSGLTDKQKTGSKILCILYSLYCRNCDSANIFIDLSETKDHLEVHCGECGYNTLIPLKKLLIHEELEDMITPENEEEIVKKYIKTLHVKHECDVVDEKPIDKD